MADVETWQNFEDVADVDAMADVSSLASAAIQSQYSHSQQFQNLALAVRDGIDATKDVDKFHQAIADPQTAYGVFLDWWGKRVGVDRYIKVNGEYVRFDDDYYRFLIFYRALCNIANATADAANQLLSMLTDSVVFVVDYQDMSINSIVIIGAISDLQAQILSQYGLLNRPAGVMTNLLVIYPDESIFGFDGSGLLPFNQGVFNPGRNIAIG